MPVSMEFLRGVVGVLAVLFSHIAGRSGARVRKGRQKLTGFYGWLLRAAVCVAGVSIRHPLEAMDIIIWFLSAAAFALGWWDVSRARPEEDLTKDMFRE
jgi:hypothetical protein